MIGPEAAARGCWSQEGDRRAEEGDAGSQGQGEEDVWKDVRVEQSFSHYYYLLYFVKYKLWCVDISSRECEEVLWAFGTGH